MVALIREVESASFKGEVKSFEALSYLCFTGSMYLILSPVFNSAIRELYFPLLMVIHFAVGAGGLYFGWQLYMGNGGSGVWIPSLAVIVLGIIITFLFIYIIPAWIIFILALLRFRQDLSELRRK